MQMRALVPLFVLALVLLTAAEGEARHCRKRGRLFRRSCCPAVCQPMCYPSRPQAYFPAPAKTHSNCQCPVEEYALDAEEQVRYWVVVDCPDVYGSRTFPYGDIPAGTPCPEVPGACQGDCEPIDHYGFKKPRPCLKKPKPRDASGHPAPKPGTTIEEAGFVKFDTGADDQGVVHAKILKITVGGKFTVFQGYEVVPHDADPSADGFSEIERCNYRVTTPDGITAEVITDGKEK